MKQRLPRKLKNAIKKAFESSLRPEQYGDRKRIVSFMYAELMDYEMNQALNDAGITTSHDERAMELGLVVPEVSLELRLDTPGFDFALN